MSDFSQRAATQLNRRQPQSWPWKSEVNCKMETPQHENATFTGHHQIIGQKGPYTDPQRRFQEQGPPPPGSTVTWARREPPEPTVVRLAPSASWLERGPRSSGRPNKAEASRPGTSPSLSGSSPRIRQSSGSQEGIQHSFVIPTSQPGPIFLADESLDGIHHSLVIPTNPPQPFFQRLRDNLSWWVKAHATQEVLALIREGVPILHPIRGNLSTRPCVRSQEETNLAMETVQEYLEVGALREIHRSQAKHLIPWFVIQKGDKLRLITDCRELNRFLEPRPFKLEGLQEIFPTLRKDMWAAKVD